LKSDEEEGSAGKGSRTQRKDRSIDKIDPAMAVQKKEITLNISPDKD